MTRVPVCRHRGRMTTLFALPFQNLFDACHGLLGLFG